LFLDSEIHEIVSIKVNEYTYTIDELKEHVKTKFIYIPSNLLNYGVNNSNKIVIYFNAKYQNDGCGVHSTIEKGGNQYLYT